MICTCIFVYGAFVFLSLPYSFSCIFNKRVWIFSEQNCVLNVPSYSVFADFKEFPFAPGFVFMNENLNDVFVGQEFCLLNSNRCFMSALSIYWSATNHSKCKNSIATIIKKFLAFNGKVLYTRNRAAHYF